MDSSTKLIREARLAREHARTPFSNYRVGAAVLARSGKIYRGCNIESTAYSTTICAERVAIFSAIAAGEEGFEALAVVTGNGGTPCGACRQVIYEQCGDIPIYLAGREHMPIEEYRAGQLLPHPFRHHEPE